MLEPKSNIINFYAFEKFNTLENIVGHGIAVAELYS
jgi:hypothetical protein